MEYQYPLFYIVKQWVLRCRTVGFTLSKRLYHFFWLHAFIVNSGYIPRYCK